jgi:hypothetical protein
VHVLTRVVEVRAGGSSSTSSQTLTRDLGALAAVSDRANRAVRSPS